MSDADDDLRLAEHLEGLLDGEARSELEARLAREPALRARRDALAAALDDASLPAVPVPAGAVEGVLARLEQEGLVEPAGEAAPPPGLLAATLGRLEAEGLVAPAAGPVAPGRPWLGQALALLLAAALGALAGRAAPRPPAPDGSRPPAVESRPAAPGDDPAGDRGRPADRALPRVLARAAAARADAATSAALLRALAATARSGAAREVEARDELARARSELAAARDALAAERTRGALERDALATRLRTAEAGRDAAERGLDVARAALRAARAEVAAATSAARSALQGPVASAARVDAIEPREGEGVVRWDAGAAAWRPVEAGALPAGVVVRGDGPRAALVVGGVRHALRDGLFVVGPAGRLEPVPAASDPGRAAAAPAAPRLDDVPDLLRRFASGSPRARAEAQQALTLLHRLHRDPGAGVLSRVGAPGGAEPEGVPPATARGWEEWWTRVRARGGAGR